MRQVDLPLEYDGIRRESGYRADIVVNDEVIVEIKAVECLLPLHKAQLLTYLRISPYKLGLLINFNTTSLKDGIYRCVL